MQTVGLVCSKTAVRVKERCRGCGQCFQQLSQHLLRTADCSKLYDVTERRAMAEEKIMAHKKAVYHADKNQYEKSTGKFRIKFKHLNIYS